MTSGEGASAPDGPAGAADGGGWVVEPPGRPWLPVTGSGGRFPVRRIYAVGRNYRAHTREMGNDPERTAAVLFTKPPDAAFFPADGRVPYPPATRELHHEVELVVALGRGGRDLDADAALAAVWGYAVGLDLTRRDLQAEAKRSGGPWDMAKGFDASAPCSAVRSAASGPHPPDGAIRLEVDGQRRQDSRLDRMVWSVGELVARLSCLVTVAPGDLIFTGTPAGVGPLEPGERVSAEIEGVGRLELRIVPGA